MTFLEAINAVLRRLREDAVLSSDQTEYGKLIGDFVNQAMNECQQAWNWNSLKVETAITTQSGVGIYDFVTENVFNVDNVINGINANRNWMMKLITAEYGERLLRLNDSLTGSPYYYWFQSGYSTKEVSLYPVPTGVELIYFLVHANTPSFNIDGTDDDEIILIPSLPVVLGAYALALSERGEDGGIGFNEADAAYRASLADAISHDASKNHISEVSWHVA